MTALSRCALAALACALPLRPQDSGCIANAPCYTAASIVNSASYAAGSLAPTTFGTIFGHNLSYLTVDSAYGGFDPNYFLGGVRVFVGGMPSRVTYASPTQVNFVVPSALPSGPALLWLTRDSTYGPVVTVNLHDSAPALFQQDAATVIATHADWTLVTPQSPAHPGEAIAIYATGLGPYSNPVLDSDVPPSGDEIQRRGEFTILLDGQPLDDRLVYYVGAAPVWVGLYQINLELPAGVGPNPEIRIGLGNRLSPPAVLLPVE
jgi:uncharacterized protein (TIGR03437 family)